jgi:hypothetical protein
VCIVRGSQNVDDTKENFFFRIASKLYAQLLVNSIQEKSPHPISISGLRDPFGTGRIAELVLVLLPSHAQLQFHCLLSQPQEASHIRIQKAPMNRIFGTSSSSKKPKPTLQDVVDQVGLAYLERHWGAFVCS